jgi:hypothetical protein
MRQPVLILNPLAFLKFDSQVSREIPRHLRRKHALAGEISLIEHIVEFQAQTPCFCIVENGGIQHGIRRDRKNSGDR